MFARAVTSTFIKKIMPIFVKPTKYFAAVDETPTIKIIFVKLIPLKSLGITKAILAYNVVHHIKFKIIVTIKIFTIIFQSLKKAKNSFFSFE
jgi:hypothetical protein